MKTSGRIRAVVIGQIFILFLLNVCVFPQKINSKPNAPNPALQPVDYSKYASVTEEDYYTTKTIGHMFVSKSWITSSPLVNTMDVFGYITLAYHPYQDPSALEFRDPSKPTIVTGIGQGWGKIVARMAGTAGTGTCSGEFHASFQLIGGFYPAPNCVLEVEIIATYGGGTDEVLCKDDQGRWMLSGPLSNWTDIFTDVRQPIKFRIPAAPVARDTATVTNITYDFTYTLTDFRASPRSEAELKLVFGDDWQSYKDNFAHTGCRSIEFNEKFNWGGTLTPESKRTPAP
jgi:hypothetical protein